MPVQQYSLSEHGNPYTAVAVSGKEWNSGEIRIEPPFLASQEWLDERGSEGAVKLSHFVPGAEATIIGFELMHTLLSIDKESRVRTAMTAIISELGTIVSRSSFLEAWDQDDIQ